MAFEIIGIDHLRGDTTASGGGQMKEYGPRPRISVARPRSAPLTEDRVRAIAREEVDAVLNEMATQALSAMEQ